MANNDKSITHFKNPLLRKVSYVLFVLGIFFVPILFTTFEDDLGMVILVAIIVFGTSIYFQWDGLSKVIYIKKNKEFSISTLFGTYANFNFEKETSRLVICETSRYLSGLQEHRTFYHIALKVSREDLIYYQGYRRSRNIPSSSEAYYISTLLIYKTQDAAMDRLTKFATKGLPITTDLVEKNKDRLLFINF